ncbi:hypothetical protein AMS68_005321 [Peltaster fructicola]|uniref:Spindle assembly checkpoint component MAD1 n=1 Tax=Peltaster fructicola TaxID=286661 RepID=A0A6H0XYI4_9PEZI|nr:hypothetical protein AMS68_005321 [Peltaster fructicola]
MARPSNQPSFNFLTGTDIVPTRSREPLRETQRQNAPPARENTVEDLRAQLKRAQYELDSIKQERELATLQHQQELHDVLDRAQEDFARAQSAQTGGESTARRLEALQREHQDVQNRAANEKAALEKKLRDLQADSRSLREELEETQTELSENGRKQRTAYEQLEHSYSTLQATLEETQTDLTSKVSILQSTQHKLLQQETDNGELEREVLRLRAQTGDAETLGIIKKELSEQVDYIQKLEETNRIQLSELRQLRRSAKSAEIVEEEKRSLETRLSLMDDLRKELAEAELQRRVLEDEKKSWQSYFVSETGTDDVTYDTPEDMARALLQERLERLNLVDKLGVVQPELTVKDDNIRMLEEQLAGTRAELEALRTTSKSQVDHKGKARLEKQRNLALKEVEYLRAQMKSLEEEETEFTPDQINEEELKRLQDLENMLDQYRAELQNLHADLSRLEAQPPESPRKRAREDDEESTERLGELRRRTKTLQDDLSQLQTRNQVLEAELKASTVQLTSLKQSRTRTLELRSNPTADFEAVKLSTITTLRTENAELLARLEGKTTKTKVVPVSTLENFKQQMEEIKADLAKAQKKEMRLKQIWTAKALEFREAVASVLGWKMDFLPNGRVKASSILYPSSIADGEEEENAIVFDGEQGTMKISGGPQSMFAREIQGLIDFWVEGRKDIPCFLAACTLEFYDKTTRAQKM